MIKTRPEPLLWLSDSRGVYIPRDFATCFSDRDKNVSGVSAEDWAILENGPGPENEFYWDTWNDVEQNAIVTDDSGVRYRLNQDGDLWLIPEGMEWDHDRDWYQWPDEEPEDYEHEDKLDRRD